MLALGACTLDEPADSDESESRVLVEYFDAQSHYPEPARWVIRDPAAWEQAWLQLSGNERPLPAVDFEREMVLVAAMGERNTSGYEIAIEKVSEDADGIHVEVLESSPGPSCGVFDVLTAPVTMVAVPRTDSAVVWVERSRTLDC